MAGGFSCTLTVPPLSVECCRLEWEGACKRTARQPRGRSRRPICKNGRTRTAPRGKAPDGQVLTGSCREVPGLPATYENTAKCGRTTQHEYQISSTVTTPLRPLERAEVGPPVATMGIEWGRTVLLNCYQNRASAGSFGRLTPQKSRGKTGNCTIRVLQRNPI
jgi:hypothetical protein